MKTLILSYRDLEPLLEMGEVIERVEEAFRLKGLGRVRMPPKLYVDLPEHGGDVRCMPAYIEDLGIVSIKLVNSHPLNPERFKLRAVMAVIALIDPKTGFPLALMDGTLITDLRTGAAGAVAAKYLARRDVEVVGLIGAGRQGRSQLKALTLLYASLKEVKVYDIAPEKAASLVEEASRSYPKLNVVAVRSAEEAVRGSDIVVTATPSRSPIVKDEWVEPGTHLNCIGADAPGKQELDPAILLRSKLVVDDVEQAVHGGEPNVAMSMGLLSKEHIYAELGEIVAGLKPGRTSESEVTVFSSTGLAVQDAVTAKLAYDKALEKGVGSYVELVAV
ncbi:MAG: alanine dehydrogenase [Thermoprotei archaeon]|nr:MAG: alanine dehydrogenase [Thermoprotei archaeon]